MKVYQNGIYRDMTPSEIEEFNRLQHEQSTPSPEPDRLTALELAVAELGATLLGGGMIG